ncbi:hypothetical protein [Curtobacterium sp. NPDC089689]|uniref:hypothetical protein n=1 Tax=Curtobacterium sp. NPDC089689 TaxID=3363968 RepID=UPI0038265F75
MQEVLEATEATWAGTITSDEAMRDVIQSAREQLRRDAGAGSPERRGDLDQLIASLEPTKNAKARSTPAGSRDLDQIRDHLASIRRGYLDRWCEHLAAAAVDEDEVELAARLIVAHLIDEGLHRSHIHGWLTNLDDEATLLDVIQAARTMLLEDARVFDFLVEVHRADADVVESFGDRWRDSDTFLNAFDDVGDTRATRPRAGAGAVSWTVVARDPHSAMAQLSAWKERVLARVRIGFGETNKLEFGPVVLDVGGGRVRTHRAEQRRIRIPSIQRHRLFDADATIGDQVDDALGLLASHSTNAYGPSIASVWAAAEGLLGRPGGRGVDVADALADIITCSFPRAEVNDLARKWAKNGGDSLARELRSERSSTRRAERMAESLGLGGPTFTEDADRAAAARYAEILRDPAGVLGRVRRYYRTTFRRLYYQRNFIMHAARFDSVTLAVASRTAPPLVAAGVDRIVNAIAAEGVRPLVLAARARNEIALLGREGGRPIHALLE